MVASCFKHLLELVTFFWFKTLALQNSSYIKMVLYFKNTDRTFSYFIFNIFKGIEDLDFLYQEV